VVEPQRVLRTVMFADIIGFARLDDSHIPAYLRLLEKLRLQLDGVGLAEAFNSWGDAFFVVMEDAASLAGLALRLRDLVQELGGPEFGFPRRLDVRISLHAGPVYRMHDPFTGRVNFWGFDINRAARLEPVTVAGHVYATQPFVALLTTEESVRASEASQAGGAAYVSPFICEYVGALPFAKNFGAEPVYHVRGRPGGGA
jgi:class 3 adenylate cyclase